MFQVLLRIIKELFQQKWVISFLMSLNLFYVILILIEPIFFKEVIDILVHSENAAQSIYSDLLQVWVLWIIVWILTIFAKLIVTVQTDRLAHREFDTWVKAFYKHVQALWMRFHMDSSSGQLVKKITKWTDGLFRVHLDLIRRIAPSVMTISILIPVVLYFNVKLWLFVIIVGTLSSIITFYIASQTFSKQWAIEDIYSDLSTLYGDTFSNMMILKSFSLWKFKNKQLQEKTDLRIAKQYPILNWWWMIISFSQILRIIVSIGIIFFGSYLHIAWEISIWEIVMFLSFSMIFLSAIESLTWTLESIFWNTAGIQQYYEVLDAVPEVQDSAWTKQLKRVSGDIEFQWLHFSYDGKRQILKDINIWVKKGEKIAFVWHTGSGKTTMTHMLLRFFEPQSGDILIDNKSIYGYSQDSLRKNIWVVFQDNSLFNTTILENIRLDSKATRKQIEYVAQKSHASDFIKNLSDGLDTIVWERWVKLSGGEKQRLAIARAFLKDAPILILDEATSALDAETEKYLQSSFDELMESRTTFIIAHRLSTIKKADRIFVFDQGRIVEEWSYKYLVAKKWIFAKLVAAQTDGFLE